MSTADLALAKSGKKICTIRRGTAAVIGPAIDLTDSRQALRVKILSVETRPYGQLTHEHAEWEGFSTVEELKKDLATYYRDMNDLDLVTVIKFELAES